MTLSAFDQFLSPVYLGIPLVALALALPWLIFPSPAVAPFKRWVTNRLLAIQSWFLKWVMGQIILPLSPTGHKWAALFMAIMIFIISLNLLGLLPYTFTPTSQLSFGLGLAFPMWLTTVLTGLRGKMEESLAHLLPPGTPVLLIPILIIIEFFSLMLRPFSLGVRLTANITAGHLLIQLFSTGAMELLLATSPIVLPAAVILLLLTMLEVAVAMIQAYVFVLLLSLYLQENI
nr:ATP synthase F0 subunit 6 [Scophthalmus aquosus]